jgi:hypothetical protein
MLVVALSLQYLEAKSSGGTAAAVRHLMYATL